ncbi:MAG: SDR family oxidoreductase [Crocinitomicaceae bacterium]|nr:SDR family oxidoreductase [Crocinitomicaceae bacterium]
MNVLLSGANGYIGMRLLPVLVEAGHTVICVVRDKKRFNPVAGLRNKIVILEFDFLSSQSVENVFHNIKCDVAFFLIHSLRDEHSLLEEYERKSAVKFVEVARNTRTNQIIFLGGITNQSDLSRHLKARKAVREILQLSGVNYTIFEAAIIVGSGSASFEIIRDLVEKIPLLLVPKWINSKCQPIAIRNVINYLVGSMLNERTYNQTFEIGGPDVMTYKQMLKVFALTRGIKSRIFLLPLVASRLSALWVYLLTSVNYSIARHFTQSMKNDVVCNENKIREIIPQQLLSYREAIDLAISAIEQNMVVSSWREAATASFSTLDINEYINVPSYGCFFDRKWIEIEKGKVSEVTHRFFEIGGTHGWYYADALWRLRGLIDKIFGGVGMKRGRRSDVDLKAGDVLDFWRVLLADRRNHRLLLFAEMKLPGHAWLEFEIIENDNRAILKQTATFRPIGLWGRIYWYAMLPFHFFIFRNMIRLIAGKNTNSVHGGKVGMGND